MNRLLNKKTEITEVTLTAIGHMPDHSLVTLMDNDFAQALTDADFMLIAVLLV